MNRMASIAQLPLGSRAGTSILRDRIVVYERVSDDEFDDVEGDAGKHEVPFDKHGVILAAVKIMWAGNKKFRKPDDPVFANKFGNQPLFGRVQHHKSPRVAYIDSAENCRWQQAHGIEWNSAAGLNHVLAWNLRCTNLKGDI